MKVGQLIEELSQFNEDMEVRAYDRQKDFGYKLDEELDILQFKDSLEPSVVVLFPVLNG